MKKYYFDVEYWNGSKYGFYADGPVSAFSRATTFAIDNAFNERIRSITERDQGIVYKNFAVSYNTFRTEQIQISTNG